MDEELQEILNRYQQYANQGDNVYFDVDEVAQLVDYFIDEGFVDDAKKILDLGMRLHPNDALINTRYAKFLYYSGKKDDAVAVLKQIPETEDVNSLIFRGEVSLASNKMDEAQNYFDRALALNAEDDTLVPTYLDLAEDFMNVTAYDRAIRYLIPAAKLEPQNLDIHSDLALCYQQIGDYELSIKQQNIVIDINPFSADAWFNMGLLYSGSKEYDKAIEAFDFSISLNDKDASVLFQKAAVLYQMGSYEESIRLFRAYLKCPKVDKADAYSSIGDCYLRMEQYGKAMRNYHFALKLDEYNLPSLMGVGVCSLELNKPEEGIEYFRQALACDPENTEALIYMAQAYAILEDDKMTIDTFERAVNSATDIPDAFMAYGTYCMDCGDYQKAEKLLNKGFRIAPDFPDLAVALSATYYKLNKYDEFRYMFLKAVSYQVDAESRFYDYCPDLAGDMASILEKSLKKDFPVSKINKKRPSIEEKNDKKKK
jgi:tetratricopeptide (TPR) repeat protein